MAERESARILIEVVAGIIPGQPEPQLTRRWAITSAEWEAVQAQARAEQSALPAEGEGLGDALLPILRAYGESNEYAALLRNPARLNWVRLEWIYL